MKKRQKQLVNIALLLFSLTVSYFIAEMVFYFFLPQPTYAVRFCRWGFEHIPNISFKHTPESKETVSFLQYNDEGFRAYRDYETDKPPDLLRVAILGDSYAEGAEVDFQYVHGTVLEEKMNLHLQGHRGKYRRAEVINAGIYAYENCQELRLFEQKVMKYRPDVVFVLYTGECRQNLKFCELRDEELTYKDFQYSKYEYLGRYVQGYVKAKSHFLNYLVNVLRRYLGNGILVPEMLNEPPTYQPPDKIEFEKESGSNEKTIEAYMHMSQEVVEVPVGDEYVHRLLYSIFEKFEALTKSYGGKLYVVFTHKPPKDYHLGRYVAGHNIGYLDVFSFIDDRRKKPTHLKIDGHWNEYGHYLVGQAFFELIRDYHLEPTG